MSPDPFAPPGGAPDSEPPLDLSALRERASARGPAGWESLAARIEAAAAPELARRAALPAPGTPVLDLVPFLARALRPALAVAAAAAVAVVVVRGTDGSVVEAAAGAYDADTTWLAEAAAPSREALARTIGLAALDPAGTADAGGRDSGALEARPFDTLGRAP